MVRRSQGLFDRHWQLSLYPGTTVPGWFSILSCCTRPSRDISPTNAAILCGAHWVFWLSTGCKRSDENVQDREAVAPSDSPGYPRACRWAANWGAPHSGHLTASHRTKPRPATCLPSRNSAAEQCHHDLAGHAIQNDGSGVDSSVGQPGLVAADKIDGGRKTWRARHRPRQRAQHICGISP